MLRSPSFISLILILLTLLSGCKARFLADEEKKAITEVVETQEQCWNDGDLVCFMNGYWQSDSLVFIGSRGLTKGWQQTLDNYKKSYPNMEKMGKLSFEVLELELLGSKNAWMTGSWKLTRLDDEPSGHFTLLWQKIKGKWVITKDHSS